MTTLDILNTDCWNAVLKFVPVQDIVRSESVSRQWRDIIMQYLLGTHLSLYLYPYSEMREYTKCHCKSRIIALWRPHHNRHLQMIDVVTKKFGLSIVAAHCTNEAVFKIIRQNCPNLECIMFVKVPSDNYNLFIDHTEDRMKLKWISLRSCDLISDDCVSKFLENETIIDLDIYSNELVSGRCLTAIKLSCLKSLCFQRCNALETQQLISAADSMTQLTALDLSDNAAEILESLHLLLDKLPNLEHLALSDFEEIDLGDELVVSVGRLSRLKRLELRHNDNVRDGWLDAVARGCTQLQSLDVAHCEVTARGLSSLCRAARALSALCVAWVRALTDDQLAACIACCPNLTFLDVMGTRVSSRLVAAAAQQSRARPLRMRVWATEVPTTEQYLGITLDFKMY